jgi:hypothetical protein
MGVNREAGGVGALLFRREVWMCGLSRFGQGGASWRALVGPGGRWECERGTGGCLA